MTPSDVLQPMEGLQDFHSAAVARGLVCHGSEHRKFMQEHVDDLRTPPELRRLFMALLTVTDATDEVDNPSDL
jgi:hypothetical protein